jgi:hypothetical protein
MTSYKKFSNVLMALLGAVMFCVTSCKEDIRSDACDIVAFTVNGEAWNVDSTTSITHTYPPLTDVTNLTPTITLSEGATISPASGVARDFSDAVTYWVTAADGSIRRQYIVKATLSLSPASITQFTVNGENWAISGTNITKVFPHRTIPNHSLTPTTIEVSPGATVIPAAGVAQDFFADAGVVYTVTGADAIAKKTYTVKATVAPSDTCDILAFSAGGEAWDIDGTNITYTCPVGMDTTKLAPTITVSAGARVSPASGVAQNFSAGVTYTVTAADGKATKIYTVKATTGAAIESFTVDGGTWTIDGTHITHTYPMAENVAALVPTITLSEGATVSPASDVAQDFSSADGVIYTVTAADGITTTIYTVKVIRPLASGITGACTWTLDGEEDNYTLIVKGKGAMGNDEGPLGGNFRDGIKTIIVEDSVTHIGDQAFSDHQNVISATIPDLVTSIGTDFFREDTSLTSMTIPPKLTAISDGFLYKCDKLTSVTIPKGVQSIGSAAFADCYGLETVTCLNPVPPTLGKGAFRFRETGEASAPEEPTCILEVPAGSVQAYKKSFWGGLKKFKDIVAIEE